MLAFVSGSIAVYVFSGLAVGYFIAKWLSLGQWVMILTGLLGFWICLVRIVKESSKEIQREDEKRKDQN